MIRLAGMGFVGFVLLALWLYCIFDVIASEEALIRNLPKTIWLLIVIFIPDIGSVAWLALGRPVYAGWRPGDTATRTRGRPLGVEDRADFAPRPTTPADDAKRLEAWEADLKRREEELRRRPDDGPAATGA